MVKRGIGSLLAAALVSGMIALGAMAQPVDQGLTAAPAVPEKFPELLKAISTELTALWGAVEDMPALKEALARPMEVAKEALKSLKEIGKPNEEAFKELVLLSLALHRVEDVFERAIGQHVRPRLGMMAPKGTAPGQPGAPGRGPEGRQRAIGKLAEVRDWVEAYLKGAMSALSPDEAAEFRRIVRGLVQGLREEFAPKGPEGERPMEKAAELGKHVIRIKALSAKLDIFLIRTIKTHEAQSQG